MDCLSTVDLINDVFGDEDDNKVVSIQKTKEYYMEHADKLLAELSLDNYFYFLQNILKKYNTLSSDQKVQIIEILNIPKPKPVIIEKIITKKVKPKINNYDDY